MCTKRLLFSTCSSEEVECRCVFVCVKQFLLCFDEHCTGAPVFSVFDYLDDK